MNDLADVDRFDFFRPLWMAPRFFDRHPETTMGEGLTMVLISMNDLADVDRFDFFRPLWMAPRFFDRHPETTMGEGLTIVLQVRRPATTWGKW